MLKLGRKIVKFRIPIFILSLLLLIPSAIGYLNTRVNYDVLYYLPDDIETMKGQDILVDEFGTGAYSMFVCEGMENKDVAALKTKIEKVDHVAKVVWYDSLSDISIPVEMLPEKIKKVLFADDSTMMFIIFDTTTSADETMDAIGDIRKLAGKQCFVSGMSAIVTDTKNLAESEVTVYVLIAVVLSCIVLALTMESYLIPFLFLASIGIAIAYNMGTNVFQGEISYITKALSAVLQLGVTMDYSIFLWHSYQEQRARFGDNHKEAMAQAIAATIKSVVGSSITTIAGFIALCFMSFTLGMDLGVVMAKGVIFGVICCVTVLPSMIMIFDRALEKTKHRQLIPDFPKVPEFLVKHHKALAFLCVALFIPFAYFQANTKVYYNLDSSLPKELESIQANEKLQKDYNMGAAHMILLDNKISEKDTYKMIDEMKVVTNAQPTKEQLTDMEFGMKVVKYVKSNAICIVKNGVTLAIGGGQTSRVWALENAIHNNPDKDFNGSVLASDAFFPFNDCVQVAADAGVQAIIQPGGSIRDQDSIDLCNEKNIPMVFSGYRHFRH